MEETLARFARALARGDADVAADLFAEDAIYEEPPRFRFEGCEAICAFFRDFAERHSDARFILLRSVADPTQSLLAAEWEWRYVSASDGQARAFTGISFITFTGDKITSWRGLSIPLDR
jgi:ketosteroid isomerase-like protein